MSRKKYPNVDFFGSRLRDYRKQRKITGIELASTIGISQGSLSDIETGKTNPSLGTIENIIRNTDIDIIWLITGEEPKQPAATQTTTPFLADLETWAHEISKDGSLDWLEQQLAVCLPTWQMWREKKKAETAPAETDQVA